MSYAYFNDPIKCPECGLDSHELCHATDVANGQKVLMCEACYEDSDKGLCDWDKAQGGEGDE